MTAGLPPLSANDDFDRPTLLRAWFHELAQVWAIDHSPLLDGVSDLYFSTFVILNSGDTRGLERSG